MATKTVEAETELETLKNEAREIANRFNEAANAGDGARIIALRARTQELHVLIEAAEIKEIDRRLPEARRRAAMVEAPEDNAAAEAEYAAAQEALRVAQANLHELHHRADVRSEARKSALFQLKDLERRRAEIVHRAANPGMAARSLAHV